MKRLLIVLLMVSLLSGCTYGNIPEKKPTVQAEISAVWIYFNELSMKAEKGGTKESFTKKITKIYDNCISKGINTVFVQVRPCCDALYQSEIFPWSEYLSGKQGVGVDYDPLQIMTDLAKDKNLSIHAWINPFRISFTDDKSLLSQDNPAVKWIDNSDKELASRVVRVNKGLYFSPASAETQKLIIDGVREIIKKYNVDGIHIDDYFYPSTDKSVDSYYYDIYKKSGGALELDEWRLNNISSFVSQMYSAIKSENSDCIFSISPAGNINNNYKQQYADVKLWCSTKGFADWIIPQLYYGFENKKLSFDTACDEWNNIVKNDSVKIIYGIAAYKINNNDDEWKSGNGIIKKQINYVKEKENYFGIAYFSYSSIVNPNNSAEFI